MSLAGAQHKLPVCLRDGELFEPIGRQSSTHILKPDSHVDGYPGRGYRGRSNIGLKSAAARQQVDELCRHIEAEAGQLMTEVFAGGTLNAGEQRIVRMITALPIAEMVARLR